MLHFQSDLQSCSCRWSETVFELRPQTGLLFIPQMIYECGEQQYNDTDSEKPKNSKKYLSQCHFVHHKSHKDWRRFEPRPPRISVVNTAIICITVQDKEA
jgi:hypothetical protein